MVSVSLQASESTQRATPLVTLFTILRMLDHSRWTAPAIIVFSDSNYNITVHAPDGSQVYPKVEDSNGNLLRVFGLNAETRFWCRTLRRILPHRNRNGFSRQNPTNGKHQRVAQSTSTSPNAEGPTKSRYTVVTSTNPIECQLLRRGPFPAGMRLPASSLLSCRIEYKPYRSTRTIALRHLDPHAVPRAARRTTTGR